MIEDVENGKVGVCIMKDMTRWGPAYLQVGNAMEIFRRNNVRFIAVNNGIDSEKPDNKDFWLIDEEAAEAVRLIFRLFLDVKNRNQIAVYLKNEKVPTPTFCMKDRGWGTAKSRRLNEENRYKWNKATLTRILTRQEYCGDVVNFMTAKHFRDKRNHYVDRSWQITENVHAPVIDRADFENVQRILENALVKRSNGDGEIRPLSSLLFCKD